MHSPSLEERFTMGSQEPVAQILITDDVQDIRESLGLFLLRHGYRTRLAASAREARSVLAETDIHLVVLDVMMPEEDGLSLCRELVCANGPPVILLTAMIMQKDIIFGLNVGADDYVTKPFSPEELLARISAVLRRKPPIEVRRRPAKRHFAGIVHNADSRIITLADGTQSRLTGGENRLLSALLDNPNVVMTRERLLDIVRSREPDAFDRTIDNIVSRLRRKLNDTDRDHPLMVTEWGKGYRLAVSEVVEWA